MKKIASVVGTRPNLIKLFSVQRAFDARSDAYHYAIHTGQHYNPSMGTNLVAELDMRYPDIVLGCRGNGIGANCGEIMAALDREFKANRPDLVVCYGDVTSTLAAAYIAAQSHIPLAHVEANLRSYDMHMPEEINRVMVDSIATLHFDIPVFGDTMIDCLIHHLDAINDTPLREDLAPGKYIVATLHRAGLVDNEPLLSNVILQLRSLAQHSGYNIAIPVHHRLAARIAHAKISTEDLLIIPPQNYLRFMKLVKESAMVITDSGGLQEEAAYLHVPTIILRDVTERTWLLETKLARLIPPNLVSFVETALDMLNSKAITAQVEMSWWDGKAGERIVEAIMQFLVNGAKK